MQRYMQWPMCIVILVAAYYAHVARVAQLAKVICRCGRWYDRQASSDSKFRSEDMAAVSTLNLKSLPAEKEVYNARTMA